MWEGEGMGDKGVGDMRVGCWDRRVHVGVMKVRA